MLASSATSDASWCFQVSEYDLKGTVRYDLAHFSC